MTGRQGQKRRAGRATSTTSTTGSPASDPARAVHFVLHVPKCAGTTVEEHFRTHLGNRFLLAPRWESVARNFVGNRYPGLEPSTLRAVDVVSGHSLNQTLQDHFPGRPIREYVLLRDPLGFLLSFYNYRWARHDADEGAPPPRFATWYAAQRRNPISRFLLNRYFNRAVPGLYALSSTARLAILERHLSSFAFVGSYRRTAEMLAGISRTLGIPETVESQNVTPNRRLHAGDLSDRMRRRIATDNALDTALHDRWADRGWNGVPDQPAPALPRADQLRYLIGDTTSVIRRKLG